MALCVFWGCVAIVCGLPVGLWWSVKICFEEQDGAVVGVSWLLPSSLASDPLGAHFQH